MPWFSKLVAEKNLLKLNFTNKHISLSVVNNKSGHTFLNASTKEDAMKNLLEGKSKKDTNAAVETAQLLCDRAKKANRNQITFERGYLKYHGRVKAIIDTLRNNGIEFVSHAKSRGPGEPTPYATPESDPAPRTEAASESNQ